MLVGEYKADLLPCPFCGSKPKGFENTVCDVTIKCKCGVRMSHRKPHKVSDDDCAIWLIGSWNERTAESETDVPS